MDYYIYGIGFVSSDAFGCGRDFHNFDPKPGPLASVLRKDVLDKPYKPFGRMDFFSKVGFSGIYFACKDAGLENRAFNGLENSSLHSSLTDTDNKIDTGKFVNAGNTAIIASSVYGCLDTDKQFFNTIRSEHGKNASPALFAYTLPNTFLGEASIYFGFTGQNFIINENSPTGLTALKMGLDTLHCGESDFVICGICDTASYEKLLISEGRYNNFSDNFNGSLFFTIGKAKHKFCYGKIKNANGSGNTNNGGMEFKGQTIKSLKGLARICIGAMKQV